jgi:SAM-dependent methyltransferase
VSRPRVDDEGVRLPPGARGTWVAVFDGREIWRFPAPEDSAEVVRWPPSMLPWLDGFADVELRSGRTVHSLGRLQFGTGGEQIEFVDAYGIPVTIDKWGLTQRSFSDRGQDVPAAMADMVLEIVEIARRECGIELWMSFGTLLGAVRAGRAIAHDSDVDLAYLSDRATPAAMAREMFGLARALHRSGLSVVPKTGSFITVAFVAEDGAAATIDIYTCFFLEGKFLATATLRTQAIDKDAVLPLRALPFEGRELPAPAEPARLLAASYGPGWREPNPGFRHEPGPDVQLRFADWFGNLMRQRRDWEVYWRHNWRQGDGDGSDFTTWGARHLVPGGPVVDLGCGKGQDAVALAREGRRCFGIDFAREQIWDLRLGFHGSGLPVSWHRVNLHDLRDALTFGTVVSRDSAGPRNIWARHLFDALPPSSREHVWRLAAMVLRDGGRMVAQFDESEETPGPPWPRFYGRGGRQFPLSRGELQAGWEAFGGRLIRRERMVVPDRQGAIRWRIVLEW